MLLAWQLPLLWVQLSWRLQVAELAAADVVQPLWMHLKQNQEYHLLGALVLVPVEQPEKLKEALAVLGAAVGV